jgi:aldehyde dehydrogenase (NAD+)
MAWKVAPALVAGNTVVAKPSSLNPLGNLLLAEAYEGLPPGVVNVVTGRGGTVGEVLIRHPDVDMVALTGSTEAGKHIASVAGSQLKRINLELGGIDPLIVFEDADLDVAVPGTAWRGSTTPARCARPPSASTWWRASRGSSPTACSNT